MFSIYKPSLVRPTFNGGSYTNEEFLFEIERILNAEKIVNAKNKDYIYTYKFNCGSLRGLEYRRNKLEETRQFENALLTYLNKYEEIYKGFENVNYNEQVKIMNKVKFSEQAKAMNGQEKEKYVEEETKRLLEKEGYSYCDLYHTFYLPKKKGGYRQIDAPMPVLKEALNELKDLIEEFSSGLTYHTSAFAYVKGRRHYDAVNKHKKNNSRWFLKLDFSDFFGSTTLDWTVETLSHIYPFCFVNQDILTEVLRVCFLNGRLPQGTPTSPIITNLMMIGIDYELSNTLRARSKEVFDIKHHAPLIYTRYADDIIISCEYNFKYTAVIKYIESVLREFKAPFKLKASKTKYGSSNGQNFILGCMLNKENEITVGWRDKAEMKAMLTNFILDFKNDKLSENWNVTDVQTVMGKLAYMKSIEPTRTNEIVAKLSEKFGYDILNTMKLVIKRGI